MDEVFAETADGIGVVQINLVFHFYLSHSLSFSLSLSLSEYSAFHGFKVEYGMCVDWAGLSIKCRSFNEVT